MKLKPITKRLKQPLAVEALEKLARHLGPGARFPRVRDLAQELGLTLATLDQALRQMEARGLIQRSPRKGIFVSDQIDRKSIALVFGRNIFLPGISPVYGQMIQQGQQRALARNEGFSFFLDIEDMNPASSDTPFHRDLVNAVKEGRVDGVILACRGNPAQEAWLQEQNIPLVVVGKADMGGASVYHDQERLIEGCINSLVVDGCESLGILGALHEHVDAFACMAAKTGKELRPEWMVKSAFADQKGAYEYEEFGYKSIRTLLRLHGDKKGALPAGLVITDDLITRGACIALGEAGLELGRDIRIATHANKGSGVLREWSEKLTLAEFDCSETVEVIFDLLERLMSPSLPARTVINIAPRIIPPHSKAPY